MAEVKDKMDKQVIVLLLNIFRKISNLIILEVNGQEVSYTEFVCNFSPNNKLDSRDLSAISIYQSIETIRAKEPRIEFINNFLTIFFRCFSFYNGDEKLFIDGFSLKNLEDWLIPMDSDTPYNVIQYISYPCKADCVFCFQKGNPPQLLKVQKERASQSEILTRIKYYSVKKKRCLFNQSTINIDEILTHPNVKEILRYYRGKSREPFPVVTNGQMLTKEMICFLKNIEPVYLGVSLNSNKAETRMKIMRDNIPYVAIKSLELLSKYQINYFVTIAWWPTISLEEIIETIKFAEKYNASYVRIFLPGFTSYYKLDYELINKHWIYIVEVLDYIRHNAKIPVDILPALYESYIKEEFDLTPTISGVTVNSPAYFSDLELGDIVLSINDEPVLDRSDCIDKLLKFSGNRKVLIRYKRYDVVKETILTENKYINTYPYINSPLFPFGIQFPAHIRLSPCKDLVRYCEKHNIEKVLLLSSKIVKPFIDYYFKSINLKKDSIKVEVPENYSLGGNIIAGGMFSVEDYITFIKKWIDLYGKPELIALPSTAFGRKSSDGWKRDMFGNSYKKIEQTFDIDVYLLSHDYYIPF